MALEIIEERPIKHLAVSVQEACERKARFVVYTNAKGKRVVPIGTCTQTEKSEEATWTGTWDELVTGYEVLLGEVPAVQVLDSGKIWRVDAELTRQPGGKGELRLIWTETEVEAGSSGDSGGDDEEEDEESDDVGNEDKPEITTSSTCVEEPILTHWRFKNIAGSQLEALNILLNGGGLNTIFKPDGSSRSVSVRSLLRSGEANVAARLILQGVTHWLHPVTEATLRWKARSNRYTPGTIETPSGVRTAPGCNWMCTGAGTEKRGKDVWQSATFRMSAKGGWNTEIYQ